MTTMDSDSESQDSDEGRRFRFEATRKDNVQVDVKSGKSEQEFCYSDIEYKDKKDKSKHDCNREHRFSKELNIDNKDLKYSTKYTKHSVESRNSRREDNKDYKSVRDVSSDTKSTSLSSKHKTKDPKRHKNRDRNEHRSDRSQERCRSRNENDRSQNDKHRSKSNEKYKHHICDKSRDKSYQSYKVRSEDHGKFRGESERYIHKRMQAKEDEGQRLEAYSSPKNIGQGHSGNESLMKRDFSVESQGYKEELNLSEFDILSETDENMSDSSEIRNRNSLSRQHNKKSKKRNLSNEYDNSPKKHVIRIESMEGSQKVNARKNDMLYGSSNNNSGAISDSSLGTTSPILTESRKDTVDLNSKEENLNFTEQTSLHLNNYDSVKATDVHSSHMYAEKSTTYGPALPPQLITNSPTSMESNTDIHFIGPCSPKYDAQNINERIEKDTLNSINRDNIMQNDSDVVFGPALPPHLLKQKCNDETNTKTIGPTLPNTIESFNNNEVDQIESEDEDGIGPLPVNHPALESNYVHRQLEQRAQLIKSEQKDEDYSMVNQREEWMIELPPTRINNLGLTARKFRMKAGPDMSDRSCWTDTPAKKAEKRKQREEEKLYNVQTSIRELFDESNETECRKNKKCEKSLLEIHQNQLQEKKRKEEKKARSTEQVLRRPFDRDIDLQVNRFDQAQKNAIINKAQRLDERFSRGKF
ncbi:transcription initiation factor TFIID subunit 1 [Bombus vosnesenskii]|uniref:Transcription initiation factor TFIID subunit 1 n=1 Tax=Bombus vosnesenskii TaxID=207650 RepID=A0A6J3KFM7_9HYME|nr:transcription initiation factor TFIID subunit 1 [Bombus vosnesenskii]XP_033351979.1 transcription initiation factor TFIID subunit 1 [Bombus vosnesenskii]